MLILLAIVNSAIALLCFILARRMLRVRRQVIQLNRDLNRWTVLLENALAQQTLALTEQRINVQQWQLMSLQWQFQQRRLVQVAKVLQLISRFSRRRFL